MPRSAPAPTTRLDDMLFENERAPAPEAQELDSEAAWAEFERLYTQEVQEGVRGGAPAPGGPAEGAAADGVGAQAAPPASFEVTQPLFAPQALASEPAAFPLPGQVLTAHDVMLEARRFNRVCPRPDAWQRLYDLIPGKIESGPLRQPNPPLVGDAWNVTSAMPKRMCLRDQVEWAEHHGALEAVMQFLKALPEDQWYHVDD